MEDFIEELLQEFDDWTENPDLLGQVNPEDYWDQGLGPRS